MLHRGLKDQVSLHAKAAQAGDLAPPDDVAAPESLVSPSRWRCRQSDTAWQLSQRGPVARLPGLLVHSGSAGEGPGGAEARLQHHPQGRRPRLRLGPPEPGDQPGRRLRCVPSGLPCSSQEGSHVPPRLQEGYAPHAQPANTSTRLRQHYPCNLRRGGALSTRSSKMPGGSGG